jgi:hypothetical protein
VRKKRDSMNTKIRLIIILLFCLFIALPHGKAEAVLGIPDNVQSATLIVPLMERGISSPYNTLTVVDSLCISPITIHWQVWDMDGNATPLKGNVTLQGSWVSDFGTILGGASGATLTQLTDGSFYHGFMTIDMVTAATSLLPTDPAYPFSGTNCLTGWTYYVRLSEGSSNGLPMVHIEGGLAASIHENIKGFYQAGDDREEIDDHSRYSADLATNGLAIADDPNNKIDYTISRVYCQGNAETRIILWAWAPAQYGTTSKPSDHVEGGPFQYWQFNESGTQIANSTVALNHIVNVINVPGDTNGQVWINNIPENFNVYAFSINSANNVANPALTWDALFESTILPQWLP